jgi:hypothetical protein
MLMSPMVQCRLDKVSIGQFYLYSRLEGEGLGGAQPPPTVKLPGTWS